MILSCRGDEMEKQEAAERERGGGMKMRMKTSAKGLKRLTRKKVENMQVQSSVCQHVTVVSSSVL